MRDPTVKIPREYVEETSPFYLWIKLATNKEDVFAKVRFLSELHLKTSDASDVVSDACHKFKHWGINAAQGALYLVARPGQSMPQQSAIEEAVGRAGPLAVDRTMEGEGITSGAWLVVVPNVPGSFEPINGNALNSTAAIVAAIRAISAKVDAMLLT